MGKVDDRGRVYVKRTKDVERARVWEYRLKDIARVTGLAEQTVRKHKSQGILIPWDFFSVAEYIRKYKS
jgi:hypothetical protein